MERERKVVMINEWYDPCLYGRATIPSGYQVDVMSRFREILCGFVQNRLNTSLSLGVPSYLAVDSTTCKVPRHCSYYSSTNPTGLSTS